MVHVQVFNGKISIDPVYLLDMTFLNAMIPPPNMAPFFTDDILGFELNFTALMLNGTSTFEYSFPDIIDVNSDIYIMTIPELADKTFIELDVYTKTLKFQISKMQTKDIG
jgi:hypothetical protein